MSIFPWVARKVLLISSQLCMVFVSVTETVGGFWLDCAILLGPVKFLYQSYFQFLKINVRSKGTFWATQRKVLIDLVFLIKL